MDSNSEINDVERLTGEPEVDDSTSVDDFIRTLEAREKDLHITSDTTVIELADAFDDSDELPEFIKDEFVATAAKEAPAKAATAAAETETAAAARLRSEISELKETITRLEDERKEMMKTSQRRARDFENYRSRTERERGETFQNQLSNLAAQMLPALDNLNRALDFALEMPEAHRAEFQQFLDGVVLVNQQVNEVLAGMGIQPIATIGKVFDPHFHEAVATDESEEFPDNVISGELLKGYRIGDRVIRHSMVRVAKSPQAEKPTGEMEAEPEPEFEFDFLHRPPPGSPDDKAPPVLPDIAE